jgi:hypothetical protein
MTVIGIAVRVVVSIRIIIGIWIVIGIVGVGVIISLLLMAFRSDYSILRKGDEADRISVKKMIFPGLNSFPINSLIRDQGCRPPQGDYFFFGHIQFNI